MGTRLIDALATTDALDDVFSDAALLQSMLEVEVALARAEARLGLIPRTAAEAIAAAADVTRFDAAAIAAAARTSATPVIPFVRALTERVQAIDPTSAGFVHWGATSQDVADTAINLCLRRARERLGDGHERLSRDLRRLSDEHAGTVMLGRTLLQPGPPITFGLKVAGWFAACRRGWTRLVGTSRDASVIQFGGAVGTLAALGQAGPEVASAVAADLGLADTGAPWHAHRDRLAMSMAAYGVYVGTLGKVARDITLLMQDEVAEVAEPGGGSSTMPHKRNPSGCAVALAAATRTPGLVATVLAAMVQEHERGVGGWHAEWPAIASIVQAAGAAQEALAGAMTGLTVDRARMRRNLEATGGIVFAEHVMMRLAGAIGRDDAHAMVGRLVEESRRSRRSFADVLASAAELTAHVPAAELQTLLLPESYLGAAETLRRRLLEHEPS